MGYRTVVVFCNDFIDQLDKDGKSVAKDLYDAILAGPRNQTLRHNLFKVVEQEHADNDVLMHIKHYGSQSLMLSYTRWNQVDPTLDLLKNAADNLGYRLVKKAVK